MRLRLYHHGDGARIAYREAGTGPPLVLLHSIGLSYREWEPVVSPLSRRFRVVLPDLPLHGDSEDRPRHPYSPEWLTEVLSGFCAEVAGPHPRVAGHELGAELALRAVCAGTLAPDRLVLMPNRMHRREQLGGGRLAWRVACRAASLPGLDRVLAYGATAVFRPSLGERLSAQHNPATHDLMRHAFSDVGGNGNRARSWAKFARRWPIEPQRHLLDELHGVSLPVLLLWTEDDPRYPLATAQEALDLLPNAQLRTLPGAGFLLAYDDPVGLARELISFCG